MVVNYSKWDALELSDDSDIEVHPNVDKRSFIRAKQNQIHMERDKRRYQIQSLRYERQVNAGLLDRIDALLRQFRDHAAQAVGAKPGEFAMNAMMSIALPAEEDRPVQPPKELKGVEQQPKYSEMIASLVDQVRQQVGVDVEDWYPKYCSEIQSHRVKVASLQQELETKLLELEKQESSKITSESIHDGFSTSLISHETDIPIEMSKDKDQKKKKKQVTKTVEVLNPHALSQEKDNVELAPVDQADESGYIRDQGEDSDSDSDDDVEASALGKEFAKIRIGQYKESLEFIGSHRQIVSEKEQDGLLVEAFNAQMDGHGAYAKQCVHQALLLQYCRSLGRDGVGLFFKRVTSPGHAAQKVFLDDVEQTYARIQSRTAEIKKSRQNEAEGAEGVEQIQLQAVEPGTEIMIQIPGPQSPDIVEQKAFAAFSQFPLKLQTAMMTRSLEEINKVLGAMTVPEAEAVVEQMSEHGMLSMEKGVIDGTTEAGRQQVEALEREAREKKNQDGLMQDPNLQQGNDGVEAQERQDLSGFANEVD